MKICSSFTGHSKLDLNDRFYVSFATFGCLQTAIGAKYMNLIEIAFIPISFVQQKQINYRPDDETKTQAPIGNIVYEIEEDDNQQNSYWPDVIDNDDNDNLYAVGKVENMDTDSSGVKQGENRKNWGKW